MHDFQSCQSYNGQNDQLADWPPQQKLAQSFSVAFTPYEKNNEVLLDTIEKLERRERALTDQIELKEIEVTELQQQTPGPYLHTDNDVNLSANSQNEIEITEIREPRRQAKQEKLVRIKQEIIQISVEKSTIRNSKNQPFLWKLISSEGEVFKSRKTILDRPCWRDDVATVEFRGTTGPHGIEVCNSDKKGLYDFIDIPELDQIRDNFL